MPRADCMTSAELTAFLLGDLPETDLDECAEHLEGCPRCEAAARALDGLADARLTPFRAAAQALAAEPAMPARVGDYAVLEEVGRGGMGVVYKARHEQLRRVVALKVMRAGAFADPEERRRFRTEAEAVARLQHPHIVQIFDVGEWRPADGGPPVPYFALEFVEGGSLAARLNGRPQPPRQAAAWLEPLARTVHYAHTQGIIHRDLKPSNVLLTASPLSPSEGERGRSEGIGLPKLCDFGVAKLLEGADVQTRSGLVLGTAEYMAPEQAETQRGPVGPHTDVYALGVILYELLTGRPPFKGSEALDVVRRLVHEEVLSPSRLQPGVPRDLVTVCLKCLEKEPAKRYQTAQELADDLRRFLDSEPVRARRVGPLGRLGRWGRRRPLLAGLAAALTLSLIGGLAGMAALGLLAEFRRRQAADNAADAQRRRAEAEDNLYFSRLAQARLAWRLNDVAEMRSLLDRCAPGPGEPDRRGWEWHYLRSLPDGDLFTFPFEWPHVEFLAFTPDGRHLLAGGGNPNVPGVHMGRVQTWQLPLGRGGGDAVPLRTLDEAQGTIRCGAVSADGRLLALGKDGPAGHLVVLRDAGTDQTVHTLRGHASPLEHVALSQNGRRLASADAGGDVKVWDVQTGAELFTLKGWWVTFTPDGRHLLTTRKVALGEADELVEWDAADGRELRRLPFRAARLSFHPDGRFVVAWKGQDVRVVDWASGQTVAALGGHGGAVLEAGFSPDGLRVATASADQTVRVWDARTGAERFTFRGHTGRVRCLAFHPGGHYLASGSQQPAEVKVWDLTRKAESQRLTPVLKNRMLGLAFAADGRHLQLFWHPGRLQTWDTRLGLPAGPNRVVPQDGWKLRPDVASALSGDGRLAAATASARPEVAVWDAATGRELQTLRGHGVPVIGVGWSRDGRRLATAGCDWNKSNREREVRVWDAATGGLLAEFRPAGVPAQVYAGVYGVFALSPDGERVAFDDCATEETPGRATDAVSARVRVCDVSSGNERTTLPATGELLKGLAFSPDGRFLATLGASGRVAVHHLDNGRSLHAGPLQGPSAGPGGLAFSPDGRLLAAVDLEQVKVWHVASGQEVLLLHEGGPRVGDAVFYPNHVAWSPDGRLLAASRYDHAVSLWDAGERGSPAARQGAARAAADRECSQHVRDALVAALALRDRFAAEFHLRALEGAEPASDEQRLGRGQLYAWLGRWEQAAADHAAAYARRPFDDPMWCHGHALLRLKVGDPSGYREVCTHLRRHFGRSTLPWVLQHLIQTRLVDPEGVGDPEELLRWAELLGTARTASLARCLLGAAQYHAGRFREAIRSCEGAQDDKSDPYVAALGRVFLAMAHARLGEAGPAREWLARSEQWLAGQRAAAADPSLSTLPVGLHWMKWLELEILHREAEAVVQAAGGGGSRP